MSDKVAASFSAVQAIVTNGQAVRFRFPGETKTVLVDTFTASAIIAAHKVVGDDNKAKIERMVAASLGQFRKVCSIAVR